MSKKPCIVCGVRPREVPDRNRMPGRPIKLVCRQCHSERLRGDLQRIFALANECDRMRGIVDAQPSNIPGESES